jgi:hypothetical protein
MRMLFYFLVILLTTSGCMSVSRQQLREVRRFAGKTEEFSSYPEKLMIGIAEIREARGVWYASSFVDPQQHLAELNAIVRERSNDDKIPGRVKIVFKVLNDYAQGLSGLASDIPFKSQGVLFDRLGKDLNELVERYNQMNEGNKLPSGAGVVLTKSMNIGSGTLLAHRQMKMLKGFINRSDTLVSGLCDEMIKFLSAQGVSQILDAEESGIQESFRFYYTKRTNPVIESDKEYVVLMKRVLELQNLRNVTIRAAGNLKTAHKTLKIELNRKKNLTEIATCLYNFYTDMEELGIAYRKMKN